MTEIRHIVFDIGKVLIHYDPNIPFSRLIPDAEERAWFFENVCTHDWNIEQDRGRSWADAEALLIEQFPEREEHIRAFRTYWAEMVPHAYDDSVAIMTGLIDAGRDVTMLTNFAADTFSEARKMYPFLNLPRGVTVSGEVGLIKPDVAIYERHVADFAAQAGVPGAGGPDGRRASCLATDDRRTQLTRSASIPEGSVMSDVNQRIAIGPARSARRAPRTRCR